ncbi:MAG: transketolase [Patescibacteria group bacterium]
MKRKVTRKKRIDVEKLSIKDLEVIANNIRQNIIRMLLSAGSGHSAGPLGMADVFTMLYYRIANITPETRKKADRDRVVLSNAHICPVLYATLAERGYMPKHELMTLRKLGSRLQGHSCNHYRPDLPIETCGGPLAQGISQAVGLALASRMNSKINRPTTYDLRPTKKLLPTWHTWCLMSDGELDEGQCWEAFMLAGKERLHELTIFVDRNNIQIDGFTEQIMPLEALADKFRAFNFSVIEIDGHNMRDILNAAQKARAIYEHPTVILCHTIPGKGVDFMENDFVWHGKPPNATEAELALHELRTLRGHLKNDSN